MPATALALVPIAGRPVPQPACRRRRVSAAAAAGGSNCSDDGGSGPTPAAGPRRQSSGADAHARTQQLRELQHRSAAHAERLEHYVQQQEFALAAAERDALQLLELQSRRLELDSAAAATSRVQHRLGTVINHRRYNYRGVVVGYDAACSAPEEWIQMMSVDLLPQGRHQPFYHVLVDDRWRPGGQTTYVAQENIMPMRAPREVSHPLVPRFFVGFRPDEGGYVPGPLLRQQYPQEF